jgi:hypothetical protein
MADGVSKSPRSFSATVGKGQLQRTALASTKPVCWAQDVERGDFCESQMQFTFACMAAVRLLMSPSLSTRLTYFSLCSDNDIVGLLDRHGVKGVPCLPVTSYHLISLQAS